MKKLIAIARKDILVKFSNPMEWLFFLVLPIVFTMVIAVSTGNGDDRIRLLVVDQADNPLSARLVAELRSARGMRPETLSLGKAEAEFSARRAPALLVIPRSFDAASFLRGELTLELRRQPTDAGAVAAARAVQAAAGRMGRAADAARALLAAEERARPLPSDGERLAFFQSALSDAMTRLEQAPPLFTVERALIADDVSYDAGANSSAGQIITWVFIPLLGISSLFAYERRKGTLKRLLVSPTGRATYLLGTIAGRMALALVQMLLLVAFGILVMRLPWARAPGALAVMLVATALAAAALGTMLGAFVRSEAQAGGLSILIGMVMALLGGCWYPLDLFPAAVRTAVKALPTTWAMRGLLDILVRGQGLAAVLPSAGVLAGFAAIFFAFGVVRFRVE